jgi:hypothetical protein
LPKTRTEWWREKIQETTNTLVVIFSFQ